MRRVAWVLLLAFAFATPWEYSLDLGEPLGNVARIAGLVLLLAAVPAVFEAGRVRKPGPLQWLTLALFLWFCCTGFWTIEPHATWEKLRAYFQVMMPVWLIWEFAESPQDLRALLRAYLAGSWVLAVLTIASLASADAGQIRFAAEGQDPNDVARFLDLGFPMAALLAGAESRWPGKLLAYGFVPAGLAAVLATGSRGGFVAALVALAGCAFLMARNSLRRLLAGVVLLPGLAAALWFLVPSETLARIYTIREQLAHGDLNQRLNIWMAGWQAFRHSPLLGTGAGTFVNAAGLLPIDTAHNTALAVAVEGGIIALTVASAIVALCVWLVFDTRGPVRLALSTALLVWLVTTLVAAVDKNRPTWLLIALIALAARLAAEKPEDVERCFPCAAGETP